MGDGNRLENDQIKSILFNILVNLGYVKITPFAKILHEFKVFSFIRFP